MLSKHGFIKYLFNSTKKLILINKKYFSSIYITITPSIMIYQNLFNKQIYVKIIYMETITILLNDKQILKLKHTFADNIVSKCPNYALFQIKVEGCTITVYTSKKAVFQGKDANIYAMPYAYASYNMTSILLH